MEFCWYLVFVGRPNAGKSSLIRRLTFANPVVGKKPGSTRRINEYRLSAKFRAIDVPGWGRIHHRTKEYEERIKDEIIAFFEENRYRIPACILVIDAKSLIDVSRRLLKKGFIPIDQELYDFLLGLKLDPVVALNKIDKLSQSELEESITYFSELINLKDSGRAQQEIIVPVSAINGTNLAILRDLIRKRLRENDVEEFERFVKVR